MTTSTPILFRFPRARGPLAALAMVSCSLLTAPAVRAQTDAPTLKVATWNLGWHLDRDAAREWMARCGASFDRPNPEARWAPVPAGTPAPADAPTGWTLRWGRGAPIDWDIGRWPPCDVYQFGGRIVPVTEAAWDARLEGLRQVLAQRVAADVIAFQEVSGVASVQTLLPGGAAAWDFCAVEGHKVQSLVIAWRRAVAKGEGCSVEAAVGLPQAPWAAQPRPGLTATLRVGGRTVKVMNVHLKSSCVSPLDEGPPAGRGQLDGEEPNCAVLQQQVAPLEAWLEAQSAGADGVVFLGDFNRNLAHEAAQPAEAAVRTAGAATEPHRAGVRTRNLWRELNDGVPAASTLALLPNRCPDAATAPGANATALARLCQDASTRRLTRDETRELGGGDALGCRNPIGLDHVTVGGRLRGEVALKVPLGAAGRTLPVDATRPVAQLGLSDHCPLVATLRWDR